MVLLGIMIVFPTPIQILGKALGRLRFVQELLEMKLGDKND